MPRGTHYFLPGMWNKVVRDITINDITDAYTALNNRSFFFRSISFSSLVFRYSVASTESRVTMSRGRNNANRTRSRNRHYNSSASRARARM